MNAPKKEPSGPSILSRVSDGAAFLSGLSVLIVTIMITFDVLMRYFLNRPQLFVDELASLILVYIIFGGLAHTFQRDGHIRVDLLTNRLNPRASRYFRFLTLAIGIGLLGIITQNTIVSSIVAYRLGRLSMVMFYPLWIPMLFIPLGVGLMALVMVARLVEEFRVQKSGRFTKSTPNAEKGID